MFKTCNNCDETKELVQFINRKKGDKKYYRNICRECYNKKHNEQHRLERLDNGGSNRIKHKPNEYMDEVQKQQTFEFLIACGWKFKEDNGIWYKEGIKDENGNFSNLKKYKKIKKSKIKKEKKFKYEYLLPKILEYYQVRKFSYLRISKILNMNASTVRTMIIKTLNLR